MLHAVPMCHWALLSQRLRLVCCSLQVSSAFLKRCKRVSLSSTDLPLDFLLLKKRSRLVLIFVESAKRVKNAVRKRTDYCPSYNILEVVALHMIDMPLIFIDIFIKLYILLNLVNIVVIYLTYWLES